MSGIRKWFQRRNCERDSLDISSDELLLFRRQSKAEVCDDRFSRDNTAAMLVYLNKAGVHAALPAQETPVM